MFFRFCESLMINVSNLDCTRTSSLHDHTALSDFGKNITVKHGCLMVALFSNSVFPVNATQSELASKLYNLDNHTHELIIITTVNDNIRAAKHTHTHTSLLKTL